MLWKLQKLMHWGKTVCESAWRPLTGVRFKINDRFLCGEKGQNRPRERK